MPATVYFVAFSAVHLWTLLVLSATAAGACAAVRLVRNRPAATAVNFAVCGGLAGLLLAGGAFKQAYDVYTHQWTLDNSLPLHICDLSVFIIALALVLAARGAGRADWANRNSARRPGAAQRLYEVSYFWGLGGTLQAILTPDVVENFPHPVFFRYFVTHGGIVVGVLVLTFGLGMRPRAKSWRWIWLLTLGLAATVLLIDVAVGGNYMYLLEKPAHPSVFDYIGRWPWSLLSQVAIGTVFLLVWYSPWWLIDRLRRRART